MIARAKSDRRRRTRPSRASKRAARRYKVGFDLRVLVAEPDLLSWKLDCREARRASGRAQGTCRGPLQVVRVDVVWRPDELSWPRGGDVRACRPRALRLASPRARASPPTDPYLPLLLPSLAQHPDPCQQR